VQNKIDVGLIVVVLAGIYHVWHRICFFLIKPSLLRHLVQRD
jgi:hypothetical protein